MRTITIAMALALSACGPISHTPTPDAGECSPPLSPCGPDLPCCGNGANVGEQSCVMGSYTDGVCRVNCDRDRDCPRGTTCFLDVSDPLPHGFCH